MTLNSKFKNCIRKIKISSIRKSSKEHISKNKPTIDIHHHLHSIEKKHQKTASNRKTSNPTNWWPNRKLRESAWRRRIPTFANPRPSFTGRRFRAFANNPRSSQGGCWSARGLNLKGKFASQIRRRRVSIPSRWIRKVVWKVRVWSRWLRFCFVWCRLFGTLRSVWCLENNYKFLVGTRKAKSTAIFN